MNERGAGDRRRLGSALALALVLAVAAGSLAQQADHLLPAAVLVIVGGTLVGGILPARWWLAAIVGLGVTVARFWTPATVDATAPAASMVATWIAPAVALAAGGFGAAMLKHLREE